MNTSTSEVIAVVIAQPTFISQDVFILTSIRTLERTSTIVSLKRQALWVLQPVKITSSYFGNYKTFNHTHRCSSSDVSTTQWWLGVQ